MGVEEHVAQEIAAKGKKGFFELALPVYTRTAAGAQ
jgi:hypothetical protein